MSEEDFCDPLPVEEDLLDINEEPSSGSSLELRNSELGLESEVGQASVGGVTVVNQMRGGEHLPNALPHAPDASAASGVVSDSDSDLDADIYGLARRRTRTGPPPAEPIQQLVSLSDDEDQNQISNQTSSAAATQATSPYGLRKRASTLSYADVEGHSDDEQDLKKRKVSLKREGLEILSLTDQKLKKYISNPNLVEKFPKWSLVMTSAEIPEDRMNLFLQFFKKCGAHAESLVFFKCRSLDLNNTSIKKLLKSLMESMSLLTKFYYQYENSADIIPTIKLISTPNFKSLTSLKIMSLNGTGIIKEPEIEVLITSGLQLHQLELGDSLWEDIQPSTLEKLLELQSSSLESLIIHGGFKGDLDKSKFTIKFPKMPKLTCLVICPKYGFISERKNPASKRQRILTLDKKVEEAFGFAIQFTSDPPRLQKLILGNLVEIEELSFSLVRKLKVFRCGSKWNLSIRFPPEGSRQALMGSDITDLQLPDALKDPSFIVKVAKNFVNLKRVWMFLPSVPVLRAFFKSMENSQLEELYLKTQFDFESTMESCLLPNHSEALKRSPLTESQVTTLKEYKHFQDYVRYYNVEMPLEEGDLMEGHSAGIRALKSLKVLELEHIPRTLLIPNPEDERKWFDFNCKFMSQTFGYERYPFSEKSHREIMSMDLDRYNWKNLEIQVPVNRFRSAGYVPVNGGGVMDEHFGIIDEDAAIFTPIGTSVRGIEDRNQVSVPIQPSMLLPQDFKNKQEG